MSDNLIQDLTIALDSICTYTCETENTREVKVTPLQLWAAVRFYLDISQEDVKAHFKEVIESYASLVTVRTSGTNGRNINIRHVEKYIINGETDVLFDEVEFVVITHTKEYLEFLSTPVH